MGRPIGNRIIEVAELLEKLGPSTAVQLTPHMPEPARPNVRNLCSRAWEHGLATWIENEKGRRVYTVKADWRGFIKQDPKTEKPKLHIVKMGEKVTRSWEGRKLVNSVFALG
jgi:hypothetical protein